VPIVEIRKIPELLTMTIVAQFAAPVQRVWAAYADARQLERFWGPPTWPATFVRHDFVVGGRSEYYLTGPNGDRARGFFDFLAIDAPHSFEVLDGFLGSDGEGDAGKPTMRIRFAFESHHGGTRATTVTTFPSIEAMEQLIAMGLEEGMRTAASQIDAVLTV
jgi:uncharacterized protein YndB with AHSA1/START domain